MSIADAMATNGMKELGYEYINFDGEYVTIIYIQLVSYKPIVINSNSSVLS